MRRNQLMLTVPVLFALALGACAKHSGKSLKAAAKVAVTKESQEAVYKKANESIEKDIATLEENGVFTLTPGFSSKRYGQKVYLPTPSNPDLVKKTLKSIISSAEAQIDVAQKMGNEDAVNAAADLKSRAEATLTRIP